VGTHANRTTHRGRLQYAYAGPYCGSQQRSVKLSPIDEEARTRLGRRDVFGVWPRPTDQCLTRDLNLQLGENRSQFEDIQDRQDARGQGLTDVGSRKRAALGKAHSVS
jgi:hypothetical protein